MVFASQLKRLAGKGALINLNLISIFTFEKKDIDNGFVDDDDV